MPRNPLFSASVSPTKTTKPTKAVNETATRVRLTHNTFDNSYFNFKTQRYAQYEPFFWKKCVAGDNEPLSVSHNVRSLPFASPILSPMHLNKDYFLVPNFAIQPNTWEYIFKNPTQGDDVPSDAHNVFPTFSGTTSLFSALLNRLAYLINGRDPRLLPLLLICEDFFSSGSLLFNLGYKMSILFDYEDVDGRSFDNLFDRLITSAVEQIQVTLNLPDSDDATGFREVVYSTDSSNSDSGAIIIDKYTILDIIRAFSGYITNLNCLISQANTPTIRNIRNTPKLSFSSVGEQQSVDYINMDTILAYQLSCAQYYVNPRVDFLYNAQLYRDNFFMLVRDLSYASGYSSLAIRTFDYNGIPVLYDYFSESYYSLMLNFFIYMFNNTSSSSSNDAITMSYVLRVYNCLHYLFGYQNTLKFGNYFTDSRTQALGYGEEGTDNVQVIDDAVSVTDLSQKLVLERFRGAVAHLDNTFEDYLAAMFHEALPPDFHYPKFIAHSEFAINGEEVSNTTSDNQGFQVTNLKSGNDTLEFNIAISMPCILIGISYISIPRVYSQIKERHYMHIDRYDMFQTMLQYFGDQEIYNKEKSDLLANPADAYGYVSRYGEYKQRVSQVSGAFLTSQLRSWLMIDDNLFSAESPDLRLATTQSPQAIRELPCEFARFLKAHAGYSLATDFHFILQYNNKNVDNRPMDINPLPLYPNSSL